jgi:ribosomal protein S18 acetylase RimI-like enzyme
MAESFHVRAARIDDAVGLAALNREFNDVEIPPDQIAAWLRFEGRSEVVVVAEVAGELGGFACVQILLSMFYGEPWAELTELYVREAHRRLGIGRALVQEGERLAQLRGAADMIVRTGVENAAARALYESLGFTARADVTLQKRLG